MVYTNIWNQFFSPQKKFLRKCSKKHPRYKKKCLNQNLWWLTNVWYPSNVDIPRHLSWHNHIFLETSESRRWSGPWSPPPGWACVWDREMHSEGGSSLGTGTPGGRYPAPPGTAPATKTVSTIYTIQYMNDIHKIQWRIFLEDVYSKVSPQIYSAAVWKPTNGKLHICWRWRYIQVRK